MSSVTILKINQRRPLSVRFGSTELEQLHGATALPPQPERPWMSQWALVKHSLRAHACFTFHIPHQMAIQL